MKRIVIFALTSFAVISALWGGALYMTSVRADKFASLYAGRVEAVATAAHDVLKRLASLPDAITLNASAIADDFAAAAEANPLYLTIGFSDKEGASLFSTYRQKPGTSLRDRKYFNDTVEKMGFAAGEFVLGKVSRRGVFHFSYPVCATEGKLNGTINVAIDLQGMAASLALQELPAGATLDLVDHRGVILCSSREPESRVGKTLPDADFTWLKGVKGAASRFVSGNGAEGRHFQSGRQLLLPDGSCYATLMLDLSTAPAERSALKIAAWLLLLAGTFILLFLIIKSGNATPPDREPR